MLCLAPAYPDCLPLIDQLHGMNIGVLLDHVAGSFGKSVNYPAVANYSRVNGFCHVDPIFQFSLKIVTNNLGIQLGLGQVALIDAGPFPLAKNASARQADRKDQQDDP